MISALTVKNIIYHIAKISPHVLNPERFALHLGSIYLRRYAHISLVHVEIQRLKWSRIILSEDGKPTPHPHSFIRDGEEKMSTVVDVSRSKGPAYTATVSSALKDLLVLKSSGSSFTGYVKDEYTLLKPVSDRVFSTSVEVTYTFPTVEITDKFGDSATEGVGKGGVWESTATAEGVRSITIDVFATDDSASVQVSIILLSINQDLI